MISLTFWGAAQVVTGSMHQLSADGQQILLDCGMYQGHRKEAEEQNRRFPFPAPTINQVVLSHAHIDHSGNLPLLVKQGFTGPIHSTPATIDLCQAMLADSARIQESDAIFANKRQEKRSKNEPTVSPLFTMADAAATQKLFHPVGYHEPFALNPNLTYEAYDAGHMLGSSSLVFTHTSGVRLAFSGDVGRPGLPIIRDPEPLPPVDYLIMESTYGDRLHEPTGAVLDKLADIVNHTASLGGRLIVPAFAVGRIQQLVLMLHELVNANRIPGMPMFVDSPLAVNVTEVFRRHPECFDDETNRFLQDHKDPFGFDRLQYIREVIDSKRLNQIQGPCVILSPSGMMEAGRVLHHLRNNIGDARNTILVTGYQAENTLGRKLIDGQTTVNIFGDPYEVHARIESLNELSGHADRDELLTWMQPMVATLKKVFLVHGEPNGTSGMVAAIRERYNLEAVAVQRGQTFPLV